MRRRTGWSRTPVETNITKFDDKSFSLARGEIYFLDITPSDEIFIQNINVASSEFIEFSEHGDPDGIWGQLYPSNYLKVDKPIFLLNRNDKEKVDVFIHRTKKVRHI